MYNTQCYNTLITKRSPKKDTHTHTFTKRTLTASTSIHHRNRPPQSLETGNREVFEIRECLVLCQTPSRFASSSSASITLLCSLLPFRALSSSPCLLPPVHPPPPRASPCLVLLLSAPLEGKFVPFFVRCSMRPLSVCLPLRPDQTRPGGQHCDAVPCCAVPRPR